MSDYLDLFSFAPTPVEMPNGKTVYLRKLSGQETMEWITRLTAVDPNSNILLSALDDSAWLLARSLTNESGVRLVTDERADEIKQLPQELIKLLSDKVCILNGLNADGQAAVEKK